MSETRVFYIVDSAEDNEELFETLEDAQAYKLSAMSDPFTARISIGMVRNAYKDEINGIVRWNYDDENDTFNIVKRGI
jgi:hypothetical protein